MPRVALFALALLLTACGGSDDPTVTAPTATSTRTASPTPTTAPTPTSTLPAGVDQLVTITIAGKKVTGADDRIKVKLGTTVRFVITSDVADEIHLHGYDKKVDVTAGGTATLTLKANIPGVFAMELEGAKFTITKLQVQ